MLLFSSRCVGLGTSWRPFKQAFRGAEETHLPSRRCFVTSNHFGYEEPHGPPEGLPADFYAIYITDDNQTAHAVAKLGWNAVVLDKLPAYARVFFDPLQDLSYVNRTAFKMSGWQFMRTGFVGRARYEPLQYAAVREAGCTQAFFMDGNVKTLNGVHVENQFFSPCSDSLKALCVSSGWYVGSRDDLQPELDGSLAQPRWSFSHASMTAATREYMELLQWKYGPSPTTIVSAKFLGWNLNHPMTPALGEWLTREAQLHYQGNIALSFLARWRPDVVENIRYDWRGSGVCVWHHGSNSSNCIA